MAFRKAYKGAFRKAAVGFQLGENLNQPPAILDDGNTVAWFDVTENVTKDGSDFVSEWGDKSGNSNDLHQTVGSNQPLFTSDGILFDGVDNFIKSDPFVLNQPEFVYAVIKQITWTLNKTFIDGNTSGSMNIYQRTVSPNIAINAGGIPVEDIAPLNSFFIVRGLFNGINSKVTINNNTPTTGNVGTGNAGGITIGNRPGLSRYSNLSIKELIIRKVSDISEDEVNIYNYLKNKYSL